MSAHVQREPYGDWSVVLWQMDGATVCIAESGNQALKASCRTSFVQDIEAGSPFLDIWLDAYDAPPPDPGCVSCRVVALRICRELRDSYPFVFSVPVIARLRFIHDIIGSA
jgi:hypothetical protein